MKKILIVLFASCNLNDNNSCLTNFDLIEQKKEIYGVVDKIYSNKNNRGLTSVDIKMKSIEIPYDYLYSSPLDQSFYKEISIGDSIIKHKGYLDLIVIKPNGSRKLYLFNCPNILHDEE